MGGVSMADQKLINEVGKYIDKYYEPAKDDIKIDKEMLSIFDQITRFRKKRTEQKVLREEVQYTNSKPEEIPEEFDVSTMQKTKIKKGMSSTMLGSAALSEFPDRGETGKSMEHDRKMLYPAHGKSNGIFLPSHRYPYRQGKSDPAGCTDIF